MTLAITKNALIALLQDKENKVIALSGKWGTGKSHLWEREIQKESGDEAIKKAQYVSLFGLRDITEVKLKLITPEALQSKGNFIKKAGDLAASVADQVSVFADIFGKALGVLSETVLLATPRLLKGKIIVIDDIERKHQTLEIDELFGFIDEFTRQHEVRFMLILNDDKLKDKTVWREFHEKIVDHEIRLNTSPSEAFSIANKLLPSKYPTHVLRAVERCGITNIRVIKKIIKVVNELLGNSPNYDDYLLNRAIPSAVLLSAIHFNGIDDGPSIEFVLRYNDFANAVSRVSGKKTDESQDDKEKNRKEASWGRLLSDLGIHSCDDYELQVVNFLKSGSVDTNSIKEIINRYMLESHSNQSSEQLSDLYLDWRWNHALTDQQLLDKAEKLLPGIHFFDAYNLTIFLETVEGLPGGHALAQSMLERWIAHFKSNYVDSGRDRNPFRNKLHPAIQAAFDEIDAKVTSKISVLDVSKLLYEERSWGPREQEVMRAATVTDFEDAIKSALPSDRRILMIKMLELTKDSASYKESFGTATEHFTQACKRIILEQAPNRLGQIIKIEFGKAGLARLLGPPD